MGFIIVTCLSTYSFTILADISMIIFALRSWTLAPKGHTENLWGWRSHEEETGK